MAEKQDIMLTGLQPTGPLHIGNYLGAVRNILNFQKSFSGKIFLFLADYHSITENYDPAHKREETLLLAAELLACGIDTSKVTMYRQSDVPEVTELCWIFNTITPMGYLERMTQYKDKSARQVENINVGLFDYPVLQAADILLPRATKVPIGQDQVQHVELTRDIARFFNNKFGQTFAEPEHVLSEIPKVMSLVDPEKKMSKSLPGSFISLADSPEEIKKKCRSAVTDSGLETEDESAGVSNLYALLDIFSKNTDLDDLAEDVLKVTQARRMNSKMYAPLKDTLAAVIVKHFADFRAKRADYLTHPEQVEKILAEGANTIRPIVVETMKEVRDKVGLGKYSKVD